MEDVMWHANGTVSYRAKKLFHFVEELSVGSDSSDLITTLNLPAITAYYHARDWKWFAQKPLQWFVESL